MAQSDPTRSPRPRGKKASVVGQPQPQVVRIGPKGVITIPEECRKAMDVGPGKYLTVIQIGRNLMLSPDINEFLALAEQFQARLAAAGVTPERLLADQEAARRQLFEQLYGQSSEKPAKRRA